MKELVCKGSFGCKSGRIKHLLDYQHEVML